MSEKKHLYIGFPCYDAKMMCSTFMSLMTFFHVGSPLLREPPVLDLMWGESHVNRVRNRLSKRFLDSKCTHLLFIDSDIAFRPDQITTLLERNVPIVGGGYAVKEVDLRWIVNPKMGITEPDETGLIEVEYAGTGFLLIAREVFERMIADSAERQERAKGLLQSISESAFVDEGLDYERDMGYLQRLVAHDRLDYQDDSAQRMGTTHNFFHSGVRHDRFLSEDWWFCDEAKRLGFKIYCDSRVQVTHVGTTDFPIKELITAKDQIELLKQQLNGK